MISLKQASIIKEQLKEENIKEFIETLLIEYASSDVQMQFVSGEISNVSHLLSLIPELADIQLHIERSISIENSQAVDLLISEVYNKKKPMDFVTLLYTSKTRFPKCNCNNGSSTLKKLFNEFVTKLKTKDGFDYNSYDDWNWLCTVVGYRDWMITFIKQNIDENFEEPKVQNDDY